MSIRFSHTVTSTKGVSVDKGGETINAMYLKENGKKRFADGKYRQYLQRYSLLREKR